MPESRSSWKDFLLRRRHAGLRSAVREVLAEAAFQRCYVHFLRNALDHLPRKADDDCLQELRWLYDRRSIEEARQDLAAWIAKWATRYARLVGWVEEKPSRRRSPSTGSPASTISIPRAPTCSNASTRRSRRRTHVLRIFPNAEACLRLVQALALETHEKWTKCGLRPGFRSFARPVRVKRASVSGGKTRS
jgi:putative transposase